MNEENKICDLPRNIRQIGEGTGKARIYIEDYAYTYIHQYAQRSLEEEELLLLVGNKFQHLDMDVVLITGAIQCPGVVRDKKNLSITKEGVEEARVIAENYFEEVTFVGYMYTQPGYGVQLTPFLKKMHKSFFSKKNNVVFLVDSIEKEEAFFLYDANDFNELEGFFVYYKKNNQMHNYMMDYKIIKHKVENIKVENVLKEYSNKRIEYVTDKESKQFIRLLSAICGILIILCGIIGYGLVSNMDEISNLRLAFKNMNNNYNEIKEEYAVLKGHEKEEIVPVFEEISVPKGQKSSHMEGEMNKEKENVSNEQKESKVKNVDQGKESEKEKLEISKPKTHVVAKGDSLIYICKKYYRSDQALEKIKELNNIEDEDLIYVGQELMLP